MTVHTAWFNGQIVHTGHRSVLMMSVLENVSYCAFLGTAVYVWLVPGAINRIMMVP